MRCGALSLSHGTFMIAERHDPCARSSLRLAVSGGLQKLLAAAATCKNVVVFSGSGLSATSGG